MSEVKPIRFGYTRISTDEFAILSEAYDPAQDAAMNVNMVFGFSKVDQILAMQAKCIFMQQNKALVVISVSCYFRILPEDWVEIYDEQSNTLLVHKSAALHFASLTVSTARGVLHAKTEKHPVNTLIIPPVNVNDFIKGDLVLSGADMTHPK